MYFCILYLKYICKKYFKKYSEILLHLYLVFNYWFWVYISRIWGGNSLGGLRPNFLEENIRDVITCFKFGDDWLRGLVSAGGQIAIAH